MKRLLLLLVCLLALCTGVCAAEPVISEMKTDCTLTGSGSCQVTQSFTLEISGAQTQLRFPLSPGAKKASVAGYNAQKQTDGDCPVLVLSDANGFTGTRSFTVMYTISGLASEADGVQTLRLPLLSAKWDYPISKYVFTVTLPKPFESYPAFSSGYYGDVISDYIDLDISESRITGVIETGLKDHESLEMTLTLDKAYFSGAYTALSFSWVGMAFILLFLALAFGYWFSSLRSAPVRVASRMLPPDAALPCDMPFLLAGGPIQFNMLVCHWASLGYLTIFCGKTRAWHCAVALIWAMNAAQQRSSCFRCSFRRAMCARARVFCTSARRRKPTKSSALLDEAAVSKKHGNPLLMRALGVLARRCCCGGGGQVPLFPAGFVRWLLLVVIFVLGGVLFGVVQYAPSAYYQGKRPAVALAAVCALALLMLAQLGEGLLAVLLVVACEVLIGILTLHGGKRTAFGDEIVAQALGYRKFLRRVTQSQLQSRLAQDSQYFYRILPYAEAMGLAGNLARTLGSTELEQCDWYQESKPLPRTAAGFYASLREALALLDLSIRK